MPEPEPPQVRTMTFVCDLFSPHDCQARSPSLSLFLFLSLAPSRPLSLLLPLSFSSLYLCLCLSSRSPLLSLCFSMRLPGTRVSEGGREGGGEKWTWRREIERDKRERGWTALPPHHLPPVSPAPFLLRPPPPRKIERSEKEKGRRGRVRERKIAAEWKRERAREKGRDGGRERERE